MTKKFIYAALAGVSLLFAGCNEDLVGDYVQPTEKHFGEEIMFGGSASYDVNGNGGTRTIYGGYDKDNEKEPVYWVPTDEVRLYCPEAAVKTADYTVNGITSNQQTTVGLTKKGEAGLQWGNPGSQHTFYGTYPIPADASLQAGVSVTGTIPDVQEAMSPTSNDGNVTFLPNMEYAYMVAKTVVASPNAIGDNVFLQFTPIATAVEIELRNDANIESFDIREVHLSSKTDDLSGSFTANLDNMTLSQQSGSVSYGTGCPTDITYGDDASKTVGVRLAQGTSTITLEPDKTLRFTIFMLPGTTSDDSIDDLQITLISSSGQKNGTLQNISVKKSKKNYMHKMPIGGKISYKQSEWLKYVEDDKVLNTLSIPGAGGAASGKATYGDKWTTDQMYLEQELSITQLWDAGIRCFEFTVDKSDADNADLGNSIVYCNSKKCGDVTLAKAVATVKGLLTAHPEEFAMVIITYQENEGWITSQDIANGTQPRNPEKFMNQLNTFWTNVSNGVEGSEVYTKWENGTETALYSSEMTVAKARGKLFCIARPTSDGEDGYVQMTTQTVLNLASKEFEEITSLTPASKIKKVTTTPHDKIVLINGWGALKDKWEARGYTSCVFHRGNINGELKQIVDEADAKFETLINYDPNRPGRPFDVAGSSSIGTLNDVTVDGKSYGYVDNLIRQGSLSPNFYYSVQTSKGNNENAAWVAEWARVSNNSKVIQATAEGENWFGNLTSDNKYFKWANSYNERLLRAQECLDFSMSKEIVCEGQSITATNTIFINSLCGYYIENLDDTNTLIESGNSFLPNTLTDYSCVYDRYRNKFWSADYHSGVAVSFLTGNSSVAGMSGNIADFAAMINSDFLTYLKAKLNAEGRLAGSTGIVLMDRVANTGDGAEIPSIIIANNFAANQNATDPTAPTSVVADGDTPLSREGVNIVWGEWE